MCHKDGILNDKGNKIELLNQEVEGLKSQLMEEDKILSDERMEQMKKDANEFLESRALGE